MIAQSTIRAFVHQTYKNETIRIDGLHFMDCRFERCTLEFAGEALPYFTRCHLARL